MCAELKGHLPAVSNENQVKAATDRPLKKSELAEVIDLRVRVEFQSAKAAYEKERQHLLLKLKSTEVAEVKKSVIARLDECEQQFSRVYAEFRSGRRRYLIEEDERQKNRQRRDRLEPLKQTGRQGHRRPSPPRKKTRSSTPAVADRPGKKHTAAHQQSALPRIRYVNDSELRSLERQGFRVVRVYGNRADCVGCGKRVELTRDKHWKTHRRTTADCEPDYTNVVFVKTGKPIAGSEKGNGKAKRKGQGSGSKGKSKTKKARTRTQADVAPVRVVGGGKKSQSAAEKRKAKRKEEEIKAVFRDMAAGRTQRVAHWGAVRGRGAPVAITKVVSGGAMGSNRRRR